MTLQLPCNLSLEIEPALVFGAWCLELSFTSQRLDCIDSGDATSGDIAGDERRRCQQKGNACKRRWVGRRNFKQQSAQHARQRQCSEESDQHSPQYEPPTVAENQPEHVLV